MSVIAYDGKTVAADMQGTYGTISRISSKIHRWENYILASNGTIAVERQLLQWFKNGAIGDEFPFDPHADSKHGGELIVFTMDGVVAYEGFPTGVPCLDKYMSWGSGGDLALGALAMGATAKEAVKVACKYNIYCGQGIEVYDLTTMIHYIYKEQEDEKNDQ